MIVKRIVKISFDVIFFDEDYNEHEYFLKHSTAEWVKEDLEGILVEEYGWRLKNVEAVDGKETVE